MGGAIEIRPNSTTTPPPPPASRICHKTVFVFFSVKTFSALQITGKTATLGVINARLLMQLSVSVSGCDNVGIVVQNKCVR